MSTSAIILLVSIGLLPLLVFASLRIRRFKQREAWHQSFAAQNALQISYQAENRFTIFGTYRDYPVQLKAIQIPIEAQEKKAVFGIKCSIPVKNPVRKCFRALKPHTSTPDLNKIVPLDKPRKVQHDLGDWLEIMTNDMLFSSRILSENVKISIFETFSARESGLLYIQDEELAFVSPELLTQKQAIEKLQKMLDLLCDIKDELK